MSKTFHRTTVTFEAISDTPLYGLELADILRECSHGDASGHETDRTEESITDKAKVAEILVAQGSDPEFLLGNKLEIRFVALEDDSVKQPALTPGIRQGRRNLYKRFGADVFTKERAEDYQWGHNLYTAVTYSFYETDVDLDELDLFIEEELSNNEDLDSIEVE